MGNRRASLAPVLRMHKPFSVRLHHPWRGCASSSQPLGKFQVFLLRRLVPSVFSLLWDFLFSGYARCERYGTIVMVFGNIFSRIISFLFGLLFALVSKITESGQSFRGVILCHKYLYALYLYSSAGRFIYKGSRNETASFRSTFLFGGISRFHRLQ